MLVVARSSMLAALLVGAASQGAVDPSSAAQNEPGTGYDGFNAPNQGGRPYGAPRQGQLPPKQQTGGHPQYFDPMAAIGSPQPANDAYNPVAMSVASAMQGPGAPLAGLGRNAPAQMAAAPQQSGDFVSGFIMGYFEKTTLMPGEMSCLRSNVHKLAKDAAAVMTEVIAVIGSLLAKQQPNYMMMAGGASQLVEIVTASKNLAKGCVKDDALFILNRTLKHLENPVYVKGRLLANGIDIARVLSDAVPGWAINDYTRVGRDVGTLMRKILLSRNTGPLKLVLPEGMPPAAVGPAVVKGIITGLFSPGTNLTITSFSDASVDVFVDLHRCIAKDAKYFSAAMNAMYLAIAQISTNLEQWQLQQQGIQTNIAQQPPQSNWMGQLSGLMGNVPKLLQRCGINNEQRLMMSRAIKSMNTVSMSFGIPGPANKTQAGILAAKKFEAATVAWKAGAYQQFGIFLGGLIRDLLLVVYPQEYHVDESGKLRAYLNKETLIDRLDDFAHNPMSNPPLLFGAIASVALFGLTIIRVARPSLRAQGSLLECEANEIGDVEALRPDGETALE